MNLIADQRTLYRFGSRRPDYPIEELFVRRWSPRAFDASPMPAADLLTILEAARWAPSAFNVQPWRFLYAIRGDAYWERYVNLLNPFNASWAKQASALVFVLSDKVVPATDSGPAAASTTHSFDAGAAWAQLALQATALGYQAHAMAGIHFEEIRRQLEVPDNYKVEVAVAIGKQTTPAALPRALQQREAPSSRRPLDEVAFAGGFAPRQADPALGENGATAADRS